MRSIQTIAILLLVPKLLPAVALAQSSQADTPTRLNAVEPGSERSPSADSLPQLASDYSRATAALNAAHQRQIESLGDLERARNLARRELLESGEVEEARAAMTQEQDEYTRERDRVLEQLQSNPAYVSDRKKAAESDDKLDALRQRTTEVVADQVTALAKQRLHYAAEATRIERDALAKDPAYQQARDRYLAAVRRSQGAVEQVEQRVEATPEVKQAKERWQEAREDLQDARTHHAAAQAAYVTALDEHREKMHYLQTHGPSEPWWLYGYGYGGVVIH